MPNHNWTQEEYELLRTTGKVPGRSWRAIRRVQLRLGLRPEVYCRRPWSKDLNDKLLLLHEQGYTASQMAQQNLLPFGRMAIQQKLRRLGLTKRIHMVKLSAVWRERLKQFLLQQWQGRTPVELAAMWNSLYSTRPVASKNVANYLRRLGVKVTYGEVSRIRRQKQREQQILAQNQAPNIIVDQIRKARAEFMRGRLEKKRDLWHGLALGDDVDDSEDAQELETNGYSGTPKTSVVE